MEQESKKQMRIDIIRHRASQTESMSDELEKKLLEQCINGSDNEKHNAVMLLCKSRLPLALSCADSFAEKGVELIDLINEANNEIELIFRHADKLQKIDKIDLYIKQRVNFALEDMTNAANLKLHLPPKEADWVRMVFKCYFRLKRETRGRFKPVDLGKRLLLSDEQTQKAMWYIKWYEAGASDFPYNYPQKYD